MTFKTKPTLDYTFSEIADLLNRGFSDYFVEFHFNEATLSSLIRMDGVDLNASRVILEEETPIGVGLVARRGWTTRVAAMTIIPTMRGQGAGQYLLETLINEANARHEHRMILEVIEINEPAVTLYQQCGFEIVQRLVGYTGQNLEEQANTALTEVDVYEVAKAVVSYGIPDLPWQLSGESLAVIGFPQRGYRLGEAYAVISDPEQTVIGLRVIVVPPPARHQGEATRLLQALTARYPERTWKAPILCPEALGVGFFEKHGFQREDLTQWQMRLDLQD